MADEPPPAKCIKYISKDPPQVASIANCNRFSFKETFEVLAGKGPDQQRFTVHRDLFTKRSKFLEAATSSRWTSGTNKPVDLTEHEPACFESFMQCVYLGKVTVPELPEYAEDNGSLRPLARLYLLADKLNDIITTNLVMDEIIRLSDELLRVPCSKFVTLAYTSTVVRSPLRKVCRDFYVHEAEDWVLEESDEGKFPFEFLKDVLLEFRRMSNQNTLDAERRKIFCVDREKCYYHQHDDEHLSTPNALKP